MQVLWIVCFMWIIRLLSSICTCGTDRVEYVVSWIIEYRSISLQTVDKMWKGSETSDKCRIFKILLR